MTFKKCLLCLALGAMLNFTVGCGLLLYPERQGTQGGKLDPVVVLLDGIGLFFFILPGVIAFAVDFVQGTIYMPGSGRLSHVNDVPEAADSPAGANSLAGMKAIKIDGPVTQAKIEAIIARETGRSVNIVAANVRVKALNADDASVLAAFAITPSAL